MSNLQMLTIWLIVITLDVVQLKFKLWKNKWGLKLIPMKWVLKFKKKLRKHAVMEVSKQKVKVIKCK